MPDFDPDATRVLTAIAALRQARLRFHEAPFGSQAADVAALEIEWRLLDVQRATRVLDGSSARVGRIVDASLAAPRPSPRAGGAPHH